MKLGGKSSKLQISKPAQNNFKKIMTVVLTLGVTAMLIVWVYSMGRKAEETVEVTMLSQGVYKNQAITAEMLVKYDMLKGEFEKYAVDNGDGTKTRRIVLWKDHERLVGSFAAYPLKANTIAMSSDFIVSRVDNSDSVLYSFPGKLLVALDIQATDLNSLKTFLQPGDRININVIYSDKIKQTEADGYGGTEETEVEVYKEETPFKNVMIADLTNKDGKSILDIYASYNEKTAYQQAALDADSKFQESVEPDALFVALTPEEEELYYYYVSKGNSKFKISMPQRVE